MRAARALALGTILCAFVAACGGPKKVPVVPPPPEVELAGFEEKKPVSEGSLLFQERNLFEDGRARRVGDILIVKIVESYSSSQQYTNQGSRSSESSAGISSFLGFMKALEDKNPRFTASSMLGTSYGYNLNAQTQLQKSSSITATLSARVVRVLPNGNLVIQARRVVKQDSDIEYIVLSGIVRPEDIEDDNSVLSTKISDLTLEYSGRGPNREMVKGPGWLVRILNAIWPF